MWNARLDEAQAGIKTARRNINNLKYADDITLMTESEEVLKSLLMKVKEESEKAGLKLNIRKTKIMASSPITSWQINGEVMETMTDFIFLGSKITADGDCSHEIKRRLLLGRKVITNLDSILKSKDITLLWLIGIRTDLLEKTLMPGKIESRGRRGDRGWDVWMASASRWTCSGSWWWTEKPGMLQFMVLQRVGHNWATELTQSVKLCKISIINAAL